MLDPDTEVLATCVLPWTMPGGAEFAAIHSNPPGQWTDRPAMTLRQKGNSRLLWVAAPLEINQPALSRKMVEGLIRRLISGPIIRTNAPRFVEILQWEKEGKRYLALINEQEESPVASFTDLWVEVPGASGAMRMPGGEKLPVEQTGNGLRIHLPRLDLFEVILLQ